MVGKIYLECSTPGDKRDSIYIFLRYRGSYDDA